MAQDITVHPAFYRMPDGSKQDTAYVVTTITQKVGPLDLVNALGSKYVRHEVGEDGDLPDDRPRDLPKSMTQRQILAVYRDEILYYGGEFMPMWGDDMGSARRGACERWIREVVDAAFPGMAGFER